ncbi:serine endoprotease DegQ [Marinobacterium aestuarii]|uniref:Serine endoprotease DegQ n=1 Tax=Marinobacterium aestuarii TaxID=1821621 RepID=A0A1A9F1F2_9GAMM|nr:Do family serine endopeptidase [Marinobacterium aestuarii]ANG63995.1 serine endoprotease DegQ [Marinobacterium aestuarii]
MARKFRYMLILVLGTLSSLSMAGLPMADGSGRELPSLAPMLEQVNPAVVNISTYTSKEQQQNPLLQDPFFRRFFNIPDEQARPRPRRRQTSAGSGVIVDAAKGSIVTNFHVIKGADEIQVSLVDGRTFEAQLVGGDPEVDIAVLQIQADALTAVSLADSDNLRVGDFVVAIGNPFGLGQTITTGVVSALGRSGLGIEGYEDFIQTDASINPGNSGGALVNLRGELVGINTAIIAPGGGNVGIGFAIPVNMAQASAAQILEHGEVKRGQIGVAIQDMTPALQKAFKLPNGQKGVLVTDVKKDSEADKAGLEAGDLIMAVNGQATPSTGQLRNSIAFSDIGETLILKVLRDGRILMLEVDVGESADWALKAGHPLLQNLTLQPNPQGPGVQIKALAPDSMAAANGLRANDILLSVNRVKVASEQDIAQALQKSDDPVLLQVERGGGVFFLVIH